MTIVQIELLRLLDYNVGNKDLLKNMYQITSMWVETQQMTSKDKTPPPTLFESHGRQL